MIHCHLQAHLGHLGSMKLHNYFGLSQFANCILWYCQRIISILETAWSRGTTLSELRQHLLYTYNTTQPLPTREGRCTVSKDSGTDCWNDWTDAAIIEYRVHEIPGKRNYFSLSMNACWMGCKLDLLVGGFRWVKTQKMQKNWTS